MAKFAHGVKLQREVNGVFQTIASVRDIAGPARELEELDTTTHDSNGWREFEGGLLSYGEITADIMYDPAEDTHIQLINELETRSKSKYRFIYPDGTESKIFQALVTSFEESMPYEDLREASLTLRTSGKPLSDVYKVTIDIIPTTGQVLLEGKIYKHEDSIYLKNGTYEYTAFAEGLATITDDFTVSGEEKTIGITL